MMHRSDSALSQAKVTGQIVHGYHNIRMSAINDITVHQSEFWLLTTVYYRWHRYAL